MGCESLVKGFPVSVTDGALRVAKYAGVTEVAATMHMKRLEPQSGHLFSGHMLHIDAETSPTHARDLGFREQEQVLGRARRKVGQLSVCWRKGLVTVLRPQEVIRAQGRHRETRSQCPTSLIILAVTSSTSSPVQGQEAQSMGFRGLAGFLIHQRRFKTLESNVGPFPTYFTDKGLEEARVGCQSRAPTSHPCSPLTFP